jgi:hypothetical protein
MIRKILIRKIKGVGHVACMGEMRKVSSGLVQINIKGRIEQRRN